MKTRDLVVSALTFVLGAVFVLSDQPGLTANVIGYSNTSAGLASFIGMIMIFSSVGLFILQASKNDRPSLDSHLKSIEKEELYRNQGTPEEYGKTSNKTGVESIKKDKYRK